MPGMSTFSSEPVLGNRRNGQAAVPTRLTSHVPAIATMDESEETPNDIAVIVCDFLEEHVTEV